MITAYIGIGSNLDSPLAQVRQACHAISKLPATERLAVSAWYRSTPVGGPANQPDYINGVACLQTRLSPQALLDALQQIERVQGRERKERWGARTLDLDILLYGDAVIDDERLQIPHPRLQQRNFVLAPLADIAPHLVLPNGCCVASLLEQVGISGLWPLETDTGEADFSSRMP
ncbi:MAG TPA: 2-amino-4-hydroxy-6-hydroxymethyldihydropteridine diphosphokinase [Pseudomonadales bacterium]|nr:2-amino-4-hydroxy-6-hydroxymethyldihydropteridine diphosphokinase [Pseudomonadales bacterium]